MSNKILIICEPGNHTDDYCFQLIHKARSLITKMGSGEVVVACFGKLNDHEAELLSGYGATKIIFYKYEDEIDVTNYIDLVSGVILHLSPSMIMFPSTRLSKKVASIISVRQDVGLTSDCINIDVDTKGNFEFYRAALNQSVIAKITCINSLFGICTVRKDVFVNHQKEYSVDANILVRNVKFADFSVVAPVIEVLGCEVAEVPQAIDISKYKTVFCIGRGVGSKKLAKKILELADSVGAGVIGTRGAVEMGIVDKERQVGQSGKSVSPKLYIGFGVSGANQHIVGLKDTDTIIAINKDKNAAIFKHADYGIVRNLEEIVTILLEELV